MIFSPDILEIPADNPFANDLLDREQYADILTSLIDTSKTGFTMSINATWGYGKTTFIRMWEAKLRAQGYSTVYINAWEKDYIQDPFAVVISTIWEQTQKQNSHVKDIATTVKELADIASKIIAYRYIGDAALDAFKKGISNDVKCNFVLDDYIEHTKRIEDFKKQLHEYVKQLQEQEGSKDKLVIFVDELDRCRPTYAIEMLERIKHLFSIENIVFVLSVDQSVLHESIKGFYGSSNISAENYLRRFVDIEYGLPEPSVDKFIEFLIKHHELDQYITEHTPNPYFSRDNTDYNNQLYLMVKTLFEAIPCSLREVEKYFNRLEYVVRTLKLNMSAFFVSVFLTYTYIFRKDIYQQIKDLKYTDAELLHVIEDLLIAGKIQLRTDHGQLAIGIMRELVLIYRIVVELQYVENDDRLTDLALFESKHLINLNSKSVFRNDQIPRMQLDKYINKIELTEALR
jgi:hypothetical protein